MKSVVAAMSVALAAVLMWAPAQAQTDFPNRTVTLVVATAAGGGADTMGRILAKKMTDLLGQSVIVENKPGAGEIIATGYVAKANPDGYTILLCSNTVVINPSLYKSLPYDAGKDLRPIGRVGGTPLAIVVRASEPYATLGEMVAYAKANPAKLSYGSPGVGTPHHMAMELIKSKTGAPIQHIPYRGAAPGLNDLLAGAIPIVVSTTVAAEPHLKSGNVRAIVSISPVQFDQVPTLSEALPGTEIELWAGIFAPAGIPKPVEDKLSNALKMTLADPDVAAQFARGGTILRWLSPDDLATTMKQEEQRWAEIIRDAGIKVE